MRRAALWLGTIPGFYYRAVDGSFIWECMCDTSRLSTPPDASPRWRRRDLAEMEKLINDAPCQCQI